MKPLLYLAPIALAGLVACSPSGDTDETSADATVEPTPVGTIEPDPNGPAANPGAPDAMGDTAPVSNDRTFPVALRGKWRLTDGPAPTAAQCEGATGDNIGKVLEIDETRFSVFENGGKFTEVKQRGAGMVRAIFDTTYADTPTSADLTFAVDPESRTLTVTDNEGRDEARVYKRCPG